MHTFVDILISTGPSSLTLPNLLRGSTGLEIYRGCVHVLASALCSLNCGHPLRSQDSVVDSQTHLNTFVVVAVFLCLNEIKFNHSF